MADKKKTSEESEPKIKMYRLKLDIDIEAASIDDARKQAKTRVAELVKTDLGEKVERVVRGKYASRSERLDQARGAIGEAKSIVEDLTSEIQSWRDNLPESLQNGDKASALEDCISNLETVEQELDEADSACDSVEFPGMFG